MFSLSGIVTFLVVLGVLVLIHEFGHYIVARYCGVQVQTFSIGFGPKIISKKWGPTEYCLSAIPLGGYVRMLGDDPGETVSPEEKDRSFLEQTLRKRIAIVLAGPVFNLLLALFIFIGVFIVGVPTLTPDIGKILDNSAALKGGLKESDKIVSINGAPILEWEEVRSTLQKQGGIALSFGVERQGRLIYLTITPTRQEARDIFGEPTSLWVIGIMPKGTQIIKQYDPFTAIWMGTKRTVDMAYLNLMGIFKLITGKISSDNIGGPILIAQMAGQQASQGILNVILFVALLSVNLGVINLLPVPVLDGGHLFFFIVEGILGRPVSLKKQEVAQKVGLALLISLMVFAFYNDIMRLITQG